MTVNIVWQYMPDKALLLPLTAVSLVGPALPVRFYFWHLFQGRKFSFHVSFYAYVH